jgi:hypothetical protein
LFGAKYAYLRLIGSDEPDFPRRAVFAFGEKESTSLERSDRAQTIQRYRRFEHIFVHSFVDAAQCRFQMLKRLSGLYRKQDRKDGMHV